jgi:hypothetical protein
MAMRPTDPTYKLKGTILRESDKAVYMDVESINGVPMDDTETHWFPLSQIAQKFTDPSTQGTDFIMASEWICKAKSLI